MKINKSDMIMKTESKMLGLIFQTAKVLQIEAVAMSGSRTDPKAPKMSFRITTWFMLWMT